MIKIRVTKNTNIVKKKFADAIEASLLASGLFLKNATAVNTVRQTGLLANSWNYRTYKHQSQFGFLPMQGTPLKQLGPEEQVSKPDNDKTVRIGSALVYAPAYNRKRMVMEKTIDVEQEKLGTIANVAFKKVFG